MPSFATYTNLAQLEHWMLFYHRVTVLNDERTAIMGYFAGLTGFDRDSSLNLCKGFTNATMAAQVATVQGPRLSLALTDVLTGLY